MPNAELRAPVMVDVRAALLRMPPQVYVADLKLLESTDGLAFDPQSKDVIRTYDRGPKGKAFTVALKPEYEFVTWRPRRGKVFIDVKQVRPLHLDHLVPPDISLDQYRRYLDIKREFIGK